MCIHVCVCTCLCVYVLVCVCLCVYMPVCVHYFCMCMSVYVYDCVCTCLCVYMSVCVHVCVYMPVYDVHVCVRTCFLYVYMSCICIHSCVCIEHVPMQTHRGQEKVVGFLLHHSCPSLSRQDPSQNLGPWGYSPALDSCCF